MNKSGIALKVVAFIFFVLVALSLTFFAYTIYLQLTEPTRQLESANEQISELEKEISTLQAQNSDLETHVAVLTEEKAMLVENIKKLKYDDSGLLPCPVCGGTDVQIEDVGSSCYVTCNECGIRSEWAGTHYDAAQKWNDLQRNDE